MTMDTETSTAPGGAAATLRRSAIAPDSEYVAPQPGVENRIAEIWQQVLDLDRVGATDNFFELGGDSLPAIELFTRLEGAFGVRLSPSTIIDHPTVARLAALLEGDVQPYSARCLIPLQAEGKDPPLFFIHEASGNLLSYGCLARRLGRGRRIFGLQYPDQDKDPIPALSLPEMAAIYVDALRRVQAKGPYHLVGYSLGGSVAYEMARQLRAAGDEVGLLVLIDAGNRDGLVTGLQRVARKLSGHLARMSEQPPWRWAAYLMGALRKEGARLRAGRLPRRFMVRSPKPLPPRLATLINETLLTALAGYDPPPYDGAIKLLRCTDSRWGKRGLGWEERARGGVEVYDLPTSHYLAISEPTAALVAAYMLQWLDEAEQARSAG